jgi:ribosome-associated toxin RatA of RatAB toxin-antitoxin module
MRVISKSAERNVAIETRDIPYSKSKMITFWSVTPDGNQVRMTEFELEYNSAYELIIELQKQFIFTSNK